MLIPEQLADLRAKAEAATPGPWKPDYRQMYVFDEAEVNICCQVRGYGGMAYTHSDAAREAQMRANNAFIVAANPATVLQLLDMVERLEKEADWLAQRLAECCLSYSEAREDEEPCGFPCCPCEENCSRAEPDNWREAARQAVRENTTNDEGTR